ncbi:MAG: signal peptidase I [Candidatus Methanodesulfokora sp.]
MSSLYRRAAREMAYIILAALLLLVIVDFGLSMVFGVKYPLAVVMSGSMEPTLEPGDLILVQKVDPASLKVGDIIVFEVPWSNTPIVHRVIAIDNGKIFTKGDNNLYPDPSYRTSGDVYGKVIEISGHPFRIPIVGYILAFTQTIYGKAILIVLLAIMVIRDIYEKE